MELVETIESINAQLVRFYGNEPQADDKPRFRVVFSDDQFEKRLTNQTDEGFDLLYPEVRLLPKYRQYIQAKYILERLVPIDQNNTDLVEKVGYEPAHVFMDSKGNYLPPRFDMCSLVCDSLLLASGRKPGMKKYNDPDVDPEYRDKVVKTMMNDLFGNETNTGDALAYKEGVTNPAGPEHFGIQQNNSASDKAEKVG